MSVRRDRAAIVTGRASDLKAMIQVSPTQLQPHTLTRSTRAAPGGVQAPAARECRYRRELGGLHVCWAARRVTIVTGADCAACPVPAMLDTVDCFYLQALVRVTPAPTAEWICGASGHYVNDSDRSDCHACRSCERVSPRQPAISRRVAR